MNWKKIALVAAAAAMIFTGCGDKNTENPEQQKPAEEVSSLDRGMEALEQGKYDEAIAFFEKMIGNEENIEHAYRGLGIAYMGREEFEAAVEAFDQALSNAGADAGRLEYDISYYKAAALVRLGRLNDALVVYDNLAAYKPEKKTYVGRGAVYARMGNMDKAREDFDSALEQDAKNYDLYIEIFQMFCEGGREDIGQEYLKRALSIDKEPDKNNFEKGKIYYYLAQYDKARAELDKVNGISEPEAVLYLARTYEKLDDPEYAQRLYREYLELDSRDGNIYNMLALAAMSTGDYEEALETVQEGIEKAEYGMQDLYHNEIVIYEKLADFDTAKEKMEVYLENYPDDEVAAKEYIFLKTRSK